MYYSKSQLESYSPRLRALLYKQDQMDAVGLKTPEHEPLFYKIIQVSREEKEAFVYMSVMMDTMYFLSQIDTIKAVRCAELFLRESGALLEEYFSTGRNPADAIVNYMGVFDCISGLYWGFYQITDEKMEQFFKLYHNAMSTYGCEWRYYHAKLKWEITSRNKQGATAAYKRFNSLPVPRGLCYICVREPAKWYYILMDEYDKAMEQCRNFISGNIPKEYMDRYETCESANSYRQYMKLCTGCLEHGKWELLTQALPIVYSQMQEFEEDFKVDCDEAVVFALYDDFAHWKNHMKEAVWEIDEKRRITPYEYMHACLKWMVYLKRLSQSGVEKADFATNEPVPLLTDEAGQYSVPELAAYFEKQADEIGEKFDESRKGFSYSKRKAFFLELSEGEGRSL